jgi:hypothetical protein
MQSTPIWSDKLSEIIESFDRNYPSRPVEELDLKKLSSLEKNLQRRNLEDWGEVFKKCESIPWNDWRPDLV